MSSAPAAVPSAATSSTARSMRTRGGSAAGCLASVAERERRTARRAAIRHGGRAARGRAVASARRRSAHPVVAIRPARAPSHETRRPRSCIEHGRPDSRERRHGPRERGVYAGQHRARLLGSALAPLLGLPAMLTRCRLAERQRPLRIPRPAVERVSPRSSNCARLTIPCCSSASARHVRRGSECGCIWGGWRSRRARGALWTTQCWEHRRRCGVQDFPGRSDRPQRRAGTARQRATPHP